MYSLNDEQVGFILNDIENRGVRIADLQENLLDHICCVIEHEYTENQDFYKFYKKVIVRFFKKEMKEIEDETIYLLTFKNYYAMKNTMKISGIISALFIPIGSILKILHLPAAGVIIVLGIATFSLIFVPLMIILKHKDDNSKSDKWIFTFGFMIALIASLGILFKTMHWTGGNILMQGSIGLFLIGFIPTFFFTRIRKPELKFNAIVSTVLMIAVGGMMLSLTNPSYSTEFKKSFYASHDFLQNNTTQMISINNSLATEDNPVHAQCSDVITYIEEIKTDLVAKSGGMDAKSMSSLRYPKNADAVSLALSETVLKELESKCITLNKVFEQNQLIIISVQDLKLNKTISAIALHELTQLQHQVAVIDNGNLNKLKGKI